MEIKINTIGIPPHIVDGLDGGNGALSAEQGKNLKTAIENLRASLAMLSYNEKKPVFPWDDPTLHEYIQDGLSLHLDGINKGDVENQWTDLVNGVAFPNHGAIPTENAWRFNGVDSWLGFQGSEYDLEFDNENCTIEWAYYKDSIGQAPSTDGAGFSLCTFGTVTSGDSHTVGLQFASAYRAKYINDMFVDGTRGETGGPHVWADPNIDIINAHSVSVNKKYAFDNEAKLVSLSANHWTTNTGGRAIGCTFKDGRPAYYCRAGKVFAIRIYNRILTEDEMRHNQEVDNKRFSLGLTL